MLNSQSMVCALLIGAGLLFQPAARAAQLSPDARASVPTSVEQLLVLDNHALHASSLAVNVAEAVLPASLRLETLLPQCEPNLSQYTDTVTVATFRYSTSVVARLHALAIAQGHYQVSNIEACLQKRRIVPQKLRSYKIYPVNTAGLSVVFPTQTTMLFGYFGSVMSGLDARDGLKPNLLVSSSFARDTSTLDAYPVWGLLDRRGTLTLASSPLGLAEYNILQGGLRGAEYSVDLARGLHFNMSIATENPLTTVLVATLIKGRLAVQKARASTQESAVLNHISLRLLAGKLEIADALSESEASQLNVLQMLAQMAR